MSRHEALRATWAPGQVWETRLDELAHDKNAWVPVADNGRAQPAWDERQDYRRREDLETIGHDGVLRAEAKERAASGVQQQPANVRPTHQHIKSGGLYREVARGFLQTAVPLGDMCELVAYVGADGRMWFRPPSEFDDEERFAALAGAGLGGTDGR